MKILIVSDTHRRDGNLQTVIEKTAPFDMLIHLGDAEGSEDRIETWCREQNENCQVHMILGNNDFFSNLEREKEISIGDYRAFLTHGHFYSVSVGRSVWRMRRGTVRYRLPCSATPISRVSIYGAT